MVAERLGVVPGRRVEADSKDLARDVLVPKTRMDEIALLGREEAERARQLEERAIRNEAERLLVVRGRDEPGALGDERQARRRRLVDVGVKEDRVVRLALAAQELEQIRRVRALHREPILLVGERVRLKEDVALVLFERRAPQASHREAPHADGTVHRFAGCEVRRPAPVVERVGCRDLDLVDHRETVSDHAGVRLGAADDLGAVALDDDEDPHSMPAR